jgi:putative beta-lysine N-acetyltransferase
MSFMKDKIVKFRQSVIQHGKENDRVYLMKLGNSRVLKVINFIQELAEQNSYSKIFAKVPDWAETRFIQAGFSTEASIPRFYDGQVKAVFMSKFLTEARKENKFSNEVENVISTALEKKKDALKTKLPECPFLMRKLTMDDSAEIVKVFKEVFETYPFPIHNPEYIKETMKQNVEYSGVWDNDRLIAVSSSEMDPRGKNSEMTDFAAIPEYRGHNLALHLLKHMEREMALKNYKTLYTIARALSYGMNITFAKAGYKFGGSLINNTNICGSIETMNIWFKSLPARRRYGAGR